MKREQKRSERRFSIFNNFNVRKVQTVQKPTLIPLQKALMRKSPPTVKRE